MKHSIVFATNNEHKLTEVRRMLGDRYEVLSLADIGCHDDIPETGATLEENSRIKARWVKDRYGHDCMADDTGLEVEALGGAPGVHSARYAPGPGHDSAANMRLLLANMEGVTDRQARFRTVITLVQGDEERTFQGIVSGEIIAAPAGCGGFGYDPIFRPEGWDRTFAEATADEKNQVSHRGRAVRALAEYLKEIEKQAKP